MTPEKVADMYLELVDFCRQKPVDMGVFALKQREYTDAFEGLPFTRQGEVSELIRIRKTV